MFFLISHRNCSGSLPNSNGPSSNVSLVSFDSRGGQRPTHTIIYNIYTYKQDTQCCSTDCLLMHRYQLYMFRTVTVHPQELLSRCCMCRLWYVVRTALSDTYRWYNVWGRTKTNPYNTHHWVRTPRTPNIFRQCYWKTSIPVTARSRAWICDSSHVGI